MVGKFGMGCKKHILNYYLVKSNVAPTISIQMQQIIHYSVIDIFIDINVYNIN